MAKFLLAHKKTAVNEGGWNHVAGDLGGETYKGISRVNFPNWEGWKIIDKKKPIAHGTIFPELEEMVHTFYVNTFWNKIRGDEITNQEIADSLYDSAVNYGVKQAVKLAQRSLSIEETGTASNSFINKLNNK